MKTLYWFAALLLITSSAFGRSLFKVEGNDITVYLEGKTAKSKLLKIEVWTPGAVKVITTKNETFANEPSLIGQRNLTPIKIKAEYSQNSIEIVTDKLMINVEEDGLVRMLNREGKILLVESFRSYEPLSTAGTYKVSQRFFLSKTEHIYGMGQEDTIKRYNLRGKTFDLNQSLSSVASPYVYSEKGYALIWDNYSKTRFADTPAGMQITSEAAKDIQFFFVYGPDLTKVVTEIRTISGKVPMLPKWAFGFWLNPALYPTPEALNTAVNKYRALGIPVESKTSVDYNLYSEEKALTEKNTADGTNTTIYAYSVLKERYRQLKDKTTDRRLCIPTHTNLPGIQQYGTFLASGSISSCWETLGVQVSAGITSTLSGLPYWSTSLGGSTPKEKCTLESRNELLVRWYQFAAMTPVFKGSKDEKEIWALGSETDPNFKAAATAVLLRYQLLPYIYTAASDVVFDNRSMMRSLLFESLTDEPSHEIDNQFLLGRSILVCPVTMQGATELPVYFPAGSNWIDFFTGKQYLGGQKTNLPVTIDHIPLFVKQGSILPIAPTVKSSEEVNNSVLEIRVYPGADGTFTLYEDAGDGLEYHQNQFAKITFEYKEKDKSLSIGAIEGVYPGIVTERVFNVVLVSEQNGIGTTYATTKQEVQYKGKKVKVKL